MVCKWLKEKGIEMKVGWREERKDCQRGEFPKWEPHLGVSRREKPQHEPETVRIIRLNLAGTNPNWRRNAGKDADLRPGHYPLPRSSRRLGAARLG
jgi:hypothetical protein